MSATHRCTLAFVMLVCCLFECPRATAEMMYAASGSGGANGELYIINETNGAVITDVGPLVDAGAHPYALSGMRFQPGTGVLYGATGVAGSHAPNFLVTIDPLTARVTPIGQMFPTVDGTAASDITFTSNGTLYAWSSADHDMYTVNVGTGATALVGVSGVGNGFGGGGLAANAADVIYATPDSQTNPPGTLRTISTIDGSSTIVGTLTGLSNVPRNHTINALAFGSAGTLYGIDSDRTSPLAHTQLASINLATGAVTDLGISAGNLDALAIQVVPEPGSLILAAFGFSGLIAWAYGRNR